MTREILWTLILGFALSGAVQAVVSRQQMRRLLPDDSPRTLVVASGLGAAWSSCSYASVALARSLFRNCADFTSTMAFQFASTSLVVELGIILAVLIDWRFTAGGLIGGPDHDRADPRVAMPDAPGDEGEPRDHLGTRQTNERSSQVDWTPRTQWSSCRS
ncbi:MAG: permease [Solirubrobacteraceae bacterium]